MSVSTPPLTQPGPSHEAHSKTAFTLDEKACEIHSLVRQEFEGTDMNKPDQVASNADMRKYLKRAKLELDTALASVDRLQSELSALKDALAVAVGQRDYAVKSNAANHDQLTALKQALKAARPAIEAGANAIDLHRLRAFSAGYSNFDDGATAERAQQLRGLLSL